MIDSRLKLTTVMLVICFLYSGYSNADPFVDCPSKAFLFQGNNVQVYGVDLMTGSYSLMENYVGKEGNINAVGFNFIDHYIYGFNTTSFEVVRIDKAFQATVLNVTGLPASTTFFVGDVADNYYYVYRQGVGFIV